MIVYKDVMAKLADMGYTSDFLRKNNLLTPYAIAAIHKNEFLNLSIINTICALLNCQPNDIIEFRYDQEVNSSLKTQYEKICTKVIRSEKEDETDDFDAE